MCVRLRWNENVWVTQGQRERILVPLLTDLRLWSMRSSTTHTPSLFPPTHSLLISSSSSHCCLSFISFSLSIPISHILLTLFSSSPVSCSTHVCGDLAICLLCVARVRVRTHSSVTVHLCRSDCVNLSQCHATLQFAICLTGSYWLAHTLVILPVSHPPVQSPHLHMRIVFRHPLFSPPYIHVSIFSLSHLLWHLYLSVSPPFPTPFPLHFFSHLNPWAL